MHEEVSETLSLEFVKFIPRKMDLVEFLVLLDEFLFFSTDDLFLLAKLVTHEILKLLPEVDFLRGIEIPTFITQL